MNSITPDDIDTAFTKVADLLEAHLVIHDVRPDKAHSSAAWVCDRYARGFKLMAESPNQLKENRSRLTAFVALPFLPPHVIRATIQRDKTPAVDVGPLPSLWDGLAQTFLQVDDAEFVAQCQTYQLRLPEIIAK